MNKMLRIFACSILVAASIANVSFAQEPTSKMLKFIPELHKAVDADAERVQEIFKDIHEHAELGFMEVRTAGIIAQELRDLGFEVKTEVGITGVVGILKNGEGPVFMFRGDMDALPIEETADIPYASKQRVTNLDGVEVPVSHMCGHDAHATWVVALGKSMNRLKDQWSGTLVLVAQPAEEPIEGAIAMINDGLYTTLGVPKPDYFLAMHSGPFPTGSVMLTGGRINTGSQHIDVTFYGSGGHGSSPHVATDPVIMAGAAIMQYQTIVSRIMDPTDTSVLTVGMVKAGETYNVIPTEAHLKIKLHYTTVEAGEKMVSSIKRISDNIARTYGITEDDMMPKVEVRGYAPPVVNSKEWIARIDEVLRDANAADKTLNKDRDIEGSGVYGLEVSASDDAFALIEGVKGVKAAYIFVGTAPPGMVAAAHKEGKEFPFFVHQPDYMIDLEALPFGTKIATVLAIDVLGR